MSELPSQIRDETHLDDLLSDPRPGVVSALQSFSGDIIFLGAGGKMGPSLVRMAKRASDQAGVNRRIIAVSRFTESALIDSLNDWGVETISGDLLDETLVAGLPDVPNVVFMTGAKFGTSGDASKTWAMNVWLPSVVCRRFPESRISAFSTGNVYPLVPVDSGGSVESDAPDPVGEYAMTAVGRERMFQYFSIRDGIPTSLGRLNYAVEMRYGVLVDLAQQVLSGTPIDLSMGYANVIWQADANAMFLQAMADAKSPAYVVNIAGPEVFSTRAVCERFGELLSKNVTFVGEPRPTALLNNGTMGHAKYGPPRVALDQIIEWTADWVQREMPMWSKPTHFEVRDGKF